ncbi:hypothetical protein DFH08DRAFT_817730 [Mycena albidolilacea]|uniref:Uncharacterized protein n=1 Tax=Mycena albidolilacea TaxID=1033008 RepID=A0AAD6ZHA4_9AGAR|nr:hypothetical protein DFH08DRAFT_817730 [Mycena albidolilacea]
MAKLPRKLKIKHTKLQEILECLRWSHPAPPGGLSGMWYRVATSCFLTKLFGTRRSRKLLGARDFTNHSSVRQASCSIHIFKLDLLAPSIGLAVSHVLQRCSRASEHSGLCSVRLPTLAAEEEYWSTMIANHAQTMGIQRMRLGQRKEAQR